VGDASYSLFLTHVPVLTLLALLLAGRLPVTPWVHTLTLPAVLLVVVCGALVCYVVLERPLIRAAQRLLRPLLRPAPRRVSPESSGVAVAEVAADGVDRV
jgi:peptidoglycan/LPS O-acetylase OafA/YrhL